MNALDRFLTASAPRPCQACRYARATAHDGLFCDRVTPFPCELERASSPVEAWLYGACGRHGRFFEAKAVGPEWITEHAAGRGIHAPSP